MLEGLSLISALMSFSVLYFMPVQEETDLCFQAFSCIKSYGGDENEMNLNCDYFILNIGC